MRIAEQMGAAGLETAWSHPGLVAVLCLSVLGVTLAGLVLARLHRHPGRGAAASRLADESGTATIEFAMVAPTLLFFALLLGQTALLMAGQTFVQYAAFAATRSAIVQIPRNMIFEGGEPSNAILSADSSAKYNRIQAAAAWAMTPVAGELSSGPGAGEAIAAGIDNYFASYSQNAPRWNTTLLANKVRYAVANTWINLELPMVISPGEVIFVPAANYQQFGPKDPVTVRVSHRFLLMFPYIARIFAQGRHDASTGSGWYTLVTANSTLTNEGIIRTLPPNPATYDLPRLNDSLPNG